MARTFGVEIEFAGSQSDVRAAFQRGGIPVNDRYGDNYDNWTVKADGSVYNGGEVASRILDFDRPEDRLEARKALTLMRSVGSAPSEQAGIHIHVGVHDMTPEQVANVAYGFVRHEDFAYRGASSGWDHMRENARTYAHPYGRDQKALLIATDFAPQSVRDIAMSDRYFGVNFQNAFSGNRYQTNGRSPLVVRDNGTIEFRLFNSTMNDARLDSFICLAVGMVKSAILGRLGSPKLNRFNTYPIGGMAEGYRSERAVLNAAMRALSGGGRVLSADDRRNLLRHWRSAVPQPSSYFGGGVMLPGWFGQDAVRGPSAPAPTVVPAAQRAYDDQNSAVYGSDDEYDEDSWDEEYYCDCGDCRSSCCTDCANEMCSYCETDEEPDF